MLTKVNYTVHTDAIKEELIPPRVSGQGFIYAGEADILNQAAIKQMQSLLTSRSLPKMEGSKRLDN